MPRPSVPERRRLNRTALKKRASLLVRRGQRDERVPCLLLDSSPGGFKIGGTFRLKRGQSVELILDEPSANVVMCKVMWIGKPGSKQGGEAGLQVLTA